MKSNCVVILQKMYFEYFKILVQQKSKKGRKSKKNNSDVLLVKANIKDNFQIKFKLLTIDQSPN